MSVQTLITDARGYASGLVNSASAALLAANQQVSAIGYSIPNFYPVALPAAPSSTLEDTPLPVMDTITLDLPAEPTDPLTFQDISPFDAGTLPTLNVTAPTISLPTEPAALAQFMGAIPSVDTTIAFPVVPAALVNPLIEAPVLNSRDEPSKPMTTLPAFTAIAPTDTSVAPTDFENRFANAYAGAAPSTIAMMDGYVDAMLAKFNPQYATQMAAIESQLSKYLAGGTGLNSSVENAIYERSRSKTTAEAQRVRDNAIREAAAMGFTMPSGAMLSAIQLARQNGADNNAQASREIVVMQAEMEQKNLQFAVTTSAGLRTALLNATISYHQNLVSINGQALDYAKTVLSAIIEVYNTAVKAFSVKLDAYKAEAGVFDTKLKSAMAGIELYRIEIAALEALTSVDKSKVDVYRARIDSLTALSNVYRAQIEAVTGRVGLEKLKLDVFQSQVQSYTSLVQAKNSEWQGYTAAIEGQTAKVKIFSTQVDAFNSQVNGYKTGIDAKSEVVRAMATTNQARASQYAATMDGYKTVVQARGDVARTKLENQRQSIVAYQAGVQAKVSYAQVKNEYYRSTSTVAIANADLQMKAMLGEIGSRQAFGKAIADLGTANAHVYSTLASASVSGMNSLSSEAVVQ